MVKQIIIDMFLTKEAFELYARQLREETAKKHGMILEEWDAAITNGTVVQQPSGSNNGTFRGEF